ncbi:DUF192 domain-containing protein [Gillisia sp. M10.2A]|uniref:DUF192 domain-containing protein n=1 Tax=Gillisia lutea TaxID=2909668 RepID=A0ABS9EHJ0_9FLAO|nr:DUF192 domain-containing protein [Gillisia lutea]MCF4102325.1 DUF192 domain-containing protein [Gillisia lutea]
MKLKINILFCGLLVGILTSCGEDSKDNREVETAEITFKKEGELYLLKAKDTIKKIDIEIADNDYEQQTGLMYRESMLEEEGMLFIFNTSSPRSFYMKNTYIPLDIIYYSQDSTVVSFYKNTTPLDETSLPSNAPAKFVLELNAGKIAEWNIEVGDKIDFKRLD